MNFIDWSDAEGVFGLLVDFVADERMECQEDSDRQRFLSDLLAQLRKLEHELPQLPASDAVQRLRDMHDSADSGFAGDPVLMHLGDCIEELERV